ncbi:hypothetical protein, partial [Floricoccus penangensis]|uniref:hypothetical protein n=1 Tax=Floricoccus penangensis TaxID=1859475 RepID=UPI00117C5094
MKRYPKYIYFILLVVLCFSRNSAYALVKDEVINQNTITSSSEQAITDNSSTMNTSETNPTELISNSDNQGTDTSSSSVYDGNKNDDLISITDSSAVTSTERENKKSLVNSIEKNTNLFQSISISKKQISTKQEIK